MVQTPGKVFAKQYGKLWETHMPIFVVVGFLVSPALITLPTSNTFHERYCSSVLFLQPLVPSMKNSVNNLEAIKGLVNCDARLILIINLFFARALQLPCTSSVRGNIAVSSTHKCALAGGWAAVAYGSEQLRRQRCERSLCVKHAPGAGCLLEDGV